MAGCLQDVRSNDRILINYSRLGRPGLWFVCLLFKDLHPPSPLVRAVWGSNFRSIIMESLFQCISTSRLLVDRECWFGRKYTGKQSRKMLYIGVYLTAICLKAQNSWYVCVCACACARLCVHFCANVWRLHLMFAQLINSGAVVLGWHIVQASLSPHPNQINSEYPPCTHRPPGKDLEPRGAASLPTKEGVGRLFKIAIGRAVKSNARFERLKANNATS